MKNETRFADHLRTTREMAANPLGMALYIGAIYIEPLSAPSFAVEWRR